MKFRRGISVAAVALLSLTGCGFGNDKAATPPASAPVSPTGPAPDVSAYSPETGTTQVLTKGKWVDVTYQLVQPVIDNRTAFAACFDPVGYEGDLGDKDYRKRTGDHTPVSSTTVNGVHAKAGYVYAQDFANAKAVNTPERQAPAFNPKTFRDWLAKQKKAGKYTEVRVAILSDPGFDQYLHVAYMPSSDGSAEKRPSTMIHDYAQTLPGHSC